MAYSISPLEERGVHASSSLTQPHGETSVSRMAPRSADAFKSAETSERGGMFARDERHARPSRGRVSLMAHYRVWLPPFAAEAAMLLAAGWLSFFLYRTVWAPDVGLPIAPGVGVVLAYAALTIYSRTHELFMPRPVVLVGVGLLALSAVGGMLAFCADAWLMGGGSRLLYTPFVTVPLILYLGRCALMFSEARFAPSLSALPAATHTRRARGARSWRRKLAFWLS